MSGWKQALESPVPNWAMTGVSVYMLISYLGEIDFSDVDRRTAYVALAWAGPPGVFRFRDSTVVPGVGSNRWR